MVKGIVSMRSYMIDHEAKVVDRIDKKMVDEGFRALHKERILWAAHERMVHLLVMLFSLFVTISFFILSLINNDVWILLGLFIIIIVAIFYIIHYFFLENTVQRWYLLADEMDQL